MDVGSFVKREEGLEQADGPGADDQDVITWRQLGAAYLAVSAADHGVAGDTTTQPRRIDLGSDRRNRSAPHVPEPQREGGGTLM